MEDIRITTRSLLRTPGFTVVVLLTLALGIGATSALYTVVDAVVLEPLPYADSDRLVTVSHPVSGLEAGRNWSLSVAGYFQFRGHNRTLDEIGVWRTGDVNLAEEGESTERLRAGVVTASLLEVLRATPAAGRLFTEADDDPGAPLIAVLGYDLWQTRYGGDPGVVGRVIRLDGRSREIVGVMRRGFQLPSVHVDLWIAQILDPAAPPMNAHFLGAVARLRDGVTIDEAERDLLAQTNRFTELFPDAYSAEFVRASRFTTEVRTLRDEVVGDVSRVLWILLGAVGLVLLIACANVANLFLVRGDARRREVAVRAALGAGRATLARLFIAESVLLGAGAAALGLALAWAAVKLLIALSPSGLPRLDAIALDASTIWFAALIALLAALVFGAVSMLRFRANPAFEVVKESGRGLTPGRARLAARNAMVVTQVAMALVLLSGAGLLWRSFHQLRAVAPGFQSNGVLVVGLALPAATYGSSTLDAYEFYEQLLDRIVAMPGVHSAGGITRLPLDGQGGCYATTLESEPLQMDAQPPCIPTAFVLPGYFESLQVRVQGRAFDRQDLRSRAGYAVVSRTLAQQLWPGQDPIGNGIKPFEEGPPYYRVIGVADDVHGDGLDTEPTPLVYYPLVGMEGEPEAMPAARFVTLTMRTERADPVTLLPAIRTALAEVDNEVAVGNVSTMQSIVDRSMQRTTFAMILLGIAATLAVLLGAVGLFGVVSYVVGRRRSEIGVRMALGARSTQVSAQVVVLGIRLVAFGIAIGAAAALMLNPLLAQLLFQVEPTDPLTIATVSALLLGVAIAASWIPAWRAASIDPVEALRAE